jgi:hypothetical protein
MRFDSITDSTFDSDVPYHIQVRFKQGVEAFKAKDIEAAHANLGEAALTATIFCHFKEAAEAYSQLAATCVLEGRIDAAADFIKQAEESLENLGDDAYDLSIRKELLKFSSFLAAA